MRIPYLLPGFPERVVNLQLPNRLPDSVVVPGYPGSPPTSLLAELASGRLVLSGDEEHGVVVAGLKVVLDVLLKNGVVEVAALQVVLASELLGLVADRAEGVLHGGAGEQLGAAHQRQVLGHLVEHVALHAAQRELQVHHEVAVLVRVRRRQAEQVVVPGPARFLFQLVALRRELGAVLLQGGDRLEERALLLLQPETRERSLVAIRRGRFLEQGLQTFYASLKAKSL